MLILERRQLTHHHLYDVPNAKMLRTFGFAYVVAMLGVAGTICAMQWNTMKKHHIIIQLRLTVIEFGTTLETTMFIGSYRPNLEAMNLILNMKRWKRRS